MNAGNTAANKKMMIAKARINAARKKPYLNTRLSNRIKAFRETGNLFEREKELARPAVKKWRNTALVLTKKRDNTALILAKKRANSLKNRKVYTRRSAEILNLVDKSARDLKNGGYLAAKKSLVAAGQLVKRTKRDFEKQMAPLLKVVYTKSSATNRGGIKKGLLGGYTLVKMPKILDMDFVLAKYQVRAGELAAAAANNRGGANNVKKANNFAKQMNNKFTTANAKDKKNGFFKRVMSKFSRPTNKNKANVMTNDEKLQAKLIKNMSRWNKFEPGRLQKAKHWVSSKLQNRKNRKELENVLRRTRQLKSNVGGGNYTNANFEKNRAAITQNLKEKQRRSRTDVFGVTEANRLATAGTTKFDPTKAPTIRDARGERIRNFVRNNLKAAKQPSLRNFLNSLGNLSDNNRKKAKIAFFMKPKEDLPDRAHEAPNINVTNKALLLPGPPLPARPARAPSDWIKPPSGDWIKSKWGPN